MTRAKLIQIAKVAIRAHQGETVEAIAIAIADGIEMFLKIEAETDEPDTTKLVTPIGDVFNTKTADFRSATLPPSPAIQKAPPPIESDRLVVMPDSPQAREALRAPRPDPGKAVEPIPVSRLADPKLTVSPNASPTQAPGEEVFWRVEKISEVLHAHTPPKIKITVEHPERGDVPITLERNVVIGAGFDSVKLSYKPAWANDDMSVQATFSTTQKELPIGEEIEKLTAAAVKLYSPRPQKLVSSNPYNPALQSSYSALLRIGVDGGSV